MRAEQEPTEAVVARRKLSDDALDQSMFISYRTGDEIPVYGQ